MNYTTKVGIISCMTCMFAVALTMGGPIRRQASQSEKTVPIGGNVTLLCPLVPDDLWVWVNWKKNNHTIYSLEFKSNTTQTNDTRYEGSNHATRLTIKDLKKTDSGLYHCKVVTLFSIKERGHALLSVTGIIKYHITSRVTSQDQEVGLPITSPGVPFRPSTTIPPQPAEDKTIFLIVFVIVISIINITVCLIFKYWERMKNLLPGSRRWAHKSTPTPVTPDSAHREIRDMEGTHTNLLGSDTHGRDDVNVDDRPEESSNAFHSLAPRSTSTPLDADSSHHGIRDEEGTHTNLLSSDTHGRDDVDVDDMPEESSNAYQSLESTCTDLLSSDTRGRDDVDVHDRPEESLNASQSLVES